MKKVLAELHNVITSLENDGMLKEASMLQNVFIKIASDPYQNMTNEEFSEAERNDIIESYAVDWALEILHNPSYKMHSTLKDPNEMYSDENAVEAFKEAVNFNLKELRHKLLTYDEAKKILNAKVKQILDERKTDPQNYITYEHE